MYTFETSLEKSNKIYGWYPIGRLALELLEERRFNLSGCFKSKETDFVGFITKIHILRYANPIFVFFIQKKNTQHYVVL